MQMTEKKNGQKKSKKKKEILTSDHVTVFFVLIGEYCCWITWTPQQSKTKHFHFYSIAWEMKGG